MRGSSQSELPLNNRNRNYAVIDIRTAGDGVGLMNQGFNTGIPVREGEAYVFSMYARRNSSFDVPVIITLEGLEGSIYSEAAIVVTSDQWTKYEARLTASATDYSGRLVLTTKGSGFLYLDMVSLFPARTFRNRPNGLREDIATLLADLRPKFMRFPGGCLIHDGSLNADDRDSMYRWKNTLGDVAERPARRNNWRYNQTLGLGYYEYFLFCEDIGAKPIPVVPGGSDPHHKRNVPLEELQPWIDEALDLIEFANGDASTPWGAIRAKLGHPEPFGLEYIGVGNEEVGERSSSGMRISIGRSRPSIRRSKSLITAVRSHPEKSTSAAGDRPARTAPTSWTNIITSRRNGCWPIIAVTIRTKPTIPKYSLANMLPWVIPITTRLQKQLI